MAETTVRLILLLSLAALVGGQSESPSMPPTLSPTKARPTPAPTPPADTAGQVISALIFITLIALVIGFGIYGWRKNKFSELTRINLDQGQTLDEEQPAGIKPDDVALAAAVGPTYFSSDEDSNKEQKREIDGEESTVIHVNEGIEQQNNSAQKRASVDEETSDEARNRAEMRRRAEAAATAAKQAEEAREKAAGDMRLKQQEEQREAARREEDAENQKRAELLAEQAEAEHRAREAELAAAKEKEEAEKAQHAHADPGVSSLGDDPFSDLGHELSQGAESSSTGDDDEELREAQAALEAAEAEQRAMEAALEAERLAEEESLNLS